MSPNFLLIMSDQHVPFASGAYGSDVALTPNIDALAARGTTFETAYCNSPICVPSRAALATGMYVHDTGNADNASPYTGAEADSWGHRASSAGIPITTIGKLHYRSVEDDTGFPEQRLPLHVREGRGDLFHALRENQPPAIQLRDAVTAARPGESEYSRFDQDVAAEACRWLREKVEGDEQWLGKVSFVTPHYPFTVPQEYLDLYPLDSLTLPRHNDPSEWDDHPAVNIYRSLCGLDSPLDHDETLRAVQAYYGLVSFMDAQVGNVLDELERTGLAENTVVVYVSDHGELLGNDGLWFKGTMNEDSVRIPTIIAGPGVPQGARNDTHVSLVDIYPTVIDVLGIAAEDGDVDRPGESLFELARSADHRERTIFSEYHSANSHTGSFMIRHGRWKYIDYRGFPERLFDIEADPHETTDLAQNPSCADILKQMRGKLRDICDPAEVDAAIRAEQRRRIDDFGGIEAVLRRPLMAYSPVGQS